MNTIDMTKFASDKTIIQKIRFKCAFAFVIAIYFVLFLLASPAHTQANYEVQQTHLHAQNTKWNDTYIIGNAEFTSRILAALDIVEAGPEWAYLLVRSNIRSIIQGVPQAGTHAYSGGHITVVSRRFTVYPNAYMDYTNFMASAFIHEAKHVVQFWRHVLSGNPRRFFNYIEDQLELEAEALQYQAKFLDAIGDTLLAQRTRDKIGTIWWTEGPSRYG